MPPKFKFTKEQITQAALEVTREQGRSGLTARALAEKLGSSVKPIFGLFKNMEEVQQEVWNAANKRYQEYLREDMASGKWPPYKASGMSYIRFAREETELFKLLFMCDRSGKAAEIQDGQLQPIIALVQKNLGLPKEDAYLFHMETWIFVHGMATMIATSYLDWDMDFVDRALTDVYLGLRQRHQKEVENNGIH